MSFSFSKDAVDELKSQIDIVDVVGRAVQLKRAGANYKGLCPFHNEKTPSFVVSPQKQIFTCFGGCGATGDVVSFVKRYYNLDFNEAVEKLAGEYGIDIKKNVYSDDREKYYEINREAARFFYRSMTESKNAGYTYIHGREIADRTIAKFGLGYADESWDSLYRHFKEKGTDEKILLELGLISEKNGKYYDKFRNRVMFPIINAAGKVIGFGGRALSAEVMPKYLNSPENRVFQKKNNLYALNVTRQEMGKEGEAIIVEGYMDVIALYQSGVKNVAASLGTALTENQAKLVGRYTKNVVLSYDADTAGQKAALRGIEVLKAEDCKVRVLHVTDGKDPDEYIKKNGREAFMKLVSEAVPYTDYKLEACKRGLDLSTDDGKLDYRKRILPILKEMTPMELDVYAKKVADDTGFRQDSIIKEVSEDNNNERERHAAPPKTEKKERSSILPQIEATVLKCIFTEPHMTEKLLTEEELFQSELGKKLIPTVFELYGLNGDLELSQVTDRLEPDESETLLKAMENVVISGNAEEVMEECLMKRKADELAEKRAALQARLSAAEEEKDQEAAERIMEQLQELHEEINTHGGKVYVNGKN